jgi:hypothetical protein
VSASPKDLLDSNPIQKFVQKELLDVKQELREREPVIQERIIACENSIKTSIDDDIPETVEILRKNAELRKRIEFERDEKIKKFDDLLAEIEADIAVLPNIEENADELKSLEEERQMAIKKKGEIEAHITALLSRLDADKVKTLEFSRAIITETINTGKQIIRDNKAELAFLKEKERRFTISAEQLHSSADSVSSNSNSISSPRLNGGP